MLFYYVHVHFPQLKLDNHQPEWFEIWYETLASWVVLYVQFSWMFHTNFLFTRCGVCVCSMDLLLFLWYFLSSLHHRVSEEYFMSGLWYSLRLHTNNLLVPALLNLNNIIKASQNICTLETKQKTMEPVMTIKSHILRWDIHVCALSIDCSPRLLFYFIVWFLQTLISILKLYHGWKMAV